MQSADSEGIHGTVRIAEVSDNAYLEVQPFLYRALRSHFSRYVY